MSFFTTSRVWKALLLNKEKKKEQLAKLEKKDEKRKKTEKITEEVISALKNRMIKGKCVLTALRMLNW